MLQHLESKTVAGLTVLLIVIVVLAILGKLTPEAVEVLKWIGGTYMGVRAAANVAENIPRKE